jgi:hypothetical protein
VNVAAAAVLSPAAAAGDIMPSGREGQMYAGAVKIVVHPMIPAAGKDADKVRAC